MSCSLLALRGTSSSRKLRSGTEQNFLQGEAQHKGQGLQVMAAELGCWKDVLVAVLEHITHIYKCNVQLYALLAATSTGGDMLPLVSICSLADQVVVVLQGHAVHLHSLCHAVSRFAIRCTLALNLSCFVMLLVRAVSRCSWQLVLHPSAQDRARAALRWTFELLLAYQTFTMLRSALALLRREPLFMAVAAPIPLPKIAPGQPCYAAAVDSRFAPC
jgi:hypothetical protein